MIAAAVERVIAVSAAMRDVVDLIERLANVESPVLLEGESGTGKDLAAHLIHYAGVRRHGPLIKIHCPSIPDERLESELLGHERGAFTDASSVKLGKLELADGGTLFFDQIDDLAPMLQAKLLRFVEEKSFERVGGTKTRSVDVRFIASASSSLRSAVSSGRFREDLYHRLNVVAVTMPPLRERREDIAPLAELFLERARDRQLTGAKSFEDAALQALKGYLWPGNVRELRAAVERAALFTDALERVPLRALPETVFENPATLWAGRERQPSLRDVETAYIRHVLERVHGSQTKAAQILGISRKTLWEKRRRYGIP